jgi:hypothetical protein
MLAEPFQLYYGRIHVGEICEPSLHQLNTGNLTGFGTFRRFISRGSDPLTNRLIDYIEMSIEVHLLSQTPEGDNIDLAQEFEKIRDIVYSNAWHRINSTSSQSILIKDAPVFFPEDCHMTWAEDE